MHQETLDLEPNETLQVNWENNWSHLTIRHNGAIIGTIEDASNMFETLRLPLPGDREVFILVVDGKLEVWYKGAELVSGLVVGQDNDFANACKALLYYSGLVALTSVLSFATARSGASAQLFAAAIFIAILVGLSVWAQQTGSKVPFWIAIALTAVNILLVLASGKFVGLITAGLLIYYLYKGTQAEHHGLKKKKRWEEGLPLDSGI